MTKKQDAPEAVSDEALDDVAGGLLLPAVQKVREAAARSADGSVKIAAGSGVNTGSFMSKAGGDPTV